MMKLILSLVLISTFACSVYSQTFLTINNDIDYKAAINNTKYTATIVDLMSSTCGYSKMMKVLNSLKNSKLIL